MELAEARGDLSAWKEGEDGVQWANSQTTARVEVGRGGGGDGVHLALELKIVEVQMLVHTGDVAQHLGADGLIGEKFFKYLLRLLLQDLLGLFVDLAGARYKRTLIAHVGLTFYKLTSSPNPS